MTDIKHTPGPWAYEISENAPDQFDIKAANGLVIAQVDRFTDLNGEDEGEANAQLFAAAPELYDVLLRITDRVQGLIPATPNMEKSPIWQAIFEARAAIDKAKS